MRKRFEVILNEFDEVEYIMDKEIMEDRDFAEFMDFVELLARNKDEIVKENEQLKQELRGMNELLESYRETIKHDAELLADATRNGYLPPLDDFVKRGYE